LEVIQLMKHFKLFVLALALVFSANVFSQWTYCPGSINMTGLGSFPFICVVDQNTAWVVGGTGGAPKVYRTTNGGTNFVNVTGSLTGPEFFAVWAHDANTCIVGDGGAVGGTGGNARLWRTTDGGTTWTNILTTGGSVGFFNGIAFSPTNPQFGYVESDAPTGAGGQFWAKSTNGGANWTTGTPFPPNVGGAGSIYCYNEQIFGNGISGTPQICITTNGGTSFTTRTLSVAGTFTSGAAVGGDGSLMLGATSTSLPNISRSTNGGATFTSVNTGAGVTGLCVIKWIPGTNAFYLCGATGANGIKRSVNGGLNWTSMTTGGITGFNDMGFKFTGGNVYGYAVAGDGSVIKVTDATLTGIDPENTTTPSEFSLQQNYPNPFNPSTTIKFSIPVAGNVTVKIYNSVGMEVMTVVNKNMQVGNYAEFVDMADFPSGIYFYTLNASSFSETKKMILVK
jgi:Secretion system C-terminal sorting domain